MEYLTFIFIGFIIFIIVSRRYKRNELEEKFDSEYRGMTHDIYTIDGSPLTFKYQLIYDVLVDGYVVSRIKYYWCRLGGKIQINEHELLVSRKFSLLPKFEIQLENGTKAVIEKNKWLTDDYSLIIDGDVFRLRYIKLMFAIFQNDSLIGKRDSENIYLPKSLSFEKKMIIVWLDTYTHFIGHWR
jgi:hypothetical protein